MTGGKGPFKYAWSSPTVVGGRPSVVAGEYTVTMTDMAGSTITASIRVKQPDPLTINLVGLSPASTGNSDGKATAKASGGTGALHLQMEQRRDNRRMPQNWRPATKP